jgi:hypothetical protein
VRLILRLNHLEATTAKGRHEMTGGTKLKAWMRIATPVATILAALFLVEIFLQIFMPMKIRDRYYWIPDGHVKARLEPHQKVFNIDGKPLRINRLGFRGLDWEWTPPPKTLRLIVLGGSGAFCYQVSDDEHTWPAQLEKMLSERLGMAVEVANLGLPGYDLSNSKINYLFSGRALHPHVALVYHTWNDMKFLRLIEKSDGPPWPVLSGKVSGENPWIITRALRRLQIVQRARAALDRFESIDVENRYTSLEKEGETAHSPVSRRAWAWFEQNFDDIARFLSMDGVMPVLISQASLVHLKSIEDRDCRLAISNDYLGMTLPRLAESWLEANSIIESAAVRNGALFVDGYNAVPHDLTHFKDHVHLLDEGAKRLAEAVADALLSNSRFTEVAKRVRAGQNLDRGQVHRPVPPKGDNGIDHGDDKRADDAGLADERADIEVQ